jgi:hypothetical protein
LLLIVAPWTRLWQHNMFLTSMPGLEIILMSLFVRGGVTGVGIITLLGGLRDLVSVLFSRQRTGVATPPADGQWP